MRIALDVSLLERPAPTGVERGLRTLRDALATHGAPHELLELRAPPGLPQALWRETALPRLLAGLRADVFHSPVAALPLRAGCPVVATLHELPWAAPARAARETGERRWTHRARVALAVRLAARLVCVSERTRAHLLVLHPSAAPRAVVIPHAVAPWFTPAPDARATDGADPRSAAHTARDVPPSLAADPADAAALARLGVLPQGYVLAVGSLRRKKNLAALLAAFAAAPAARGLRLVLAGPDGDAAAALRARAAEPDLAGRVHFPGHVDETTLRALYRGARCVAFPSLFEGFGLPVLEAMACGAPVLASEEGAAPEACGDAVQRCQAGDVASITRELDALLASPQLRAGLVARGAAHAARHGAAALAAAHVAAYADAVAAGRPR